MHIDGTDGNDRLTGTAQRDTIAAGAGNDTVKSLGGNDLLLGQQGNDTLNGDGGNDRLSGGPGDDTYVGGGGRDTFVINGDDDTILDFGNGADKLQIYAGTGGDPDPVLTFDELNTSGGNALESRDEGVDIVTYHGERSLHIDVGAGWALTLQGVTSLHESDFYL